MDIVEYVVTENIQFPNMRAQVVEALRALSDRQYQESIWGKCDPAVNAYDDLDISVHMLYDDALVLPEPETCVPSLLHESEVPALRAVDAVLGPMIRDLGDCPDDVYLADPRWPAVVRAAGEAFTTLTTNDAMDPK